MSEELHASDSRYAPRYLQHDVTQYDAAQYDVTVLTTALSCSSLHTDRTLLGDTHTDTVVTIYNLSELLLVMGTEGKQRTVVSSYCAHRARQHGSNSNSVTQPPSTSSSHSRMYEFPRTCTHAHRSAHVFTTNSDLICAYGNVLCVT